MPGSDCHYPNPPSGRHVRCIHTRKKGGASAPEPMAPCSLRGRRTRTQALLTGAFLSSHCALHRGVLSEVVTVHGPGQSANASCYQVAGCAPVPALQRPHAPESIKNCHFALNDLLGQLEHIRLETHVWDFVEIFLRIPDLLRIAECGPHQTLLPRLEHDDPLAFRQDDTTERRHVLAAHGLTESAVFAHSRHRGI